MKFSEQWLREWVNPPVGTEELAEQLTSAGLEVDSCDAVAGEFTGVVIAELLKVSRHPQADRLSLCQVSTGEGEPVSVVCGATNVFAGMRAPLARPGARLPGGTKIRKSTIRGEVSNGMLCSAAELALSEDADGIISLPADAPLGVSLVDYLELDDIAIDVDLTPNRGDCLGISGLAREVGVLNRCPVTSPVGGPVPAQSEVRVDIALDDPQHCPRYVGRVIQGIDRNAKTPIWMAERLRRSGIRSISPVVDVTQYVMLELGQPMHAFDLKEIERGIRVRRARAGERLTLLDGQEVALDESTLVIADEEKPVAMAGVMGGLDSSVTGATDDILLESAWFEPRIIRVESRRYGLHTDASHRYERGVDSELQRAAAERATELVLQLCGGTPGPIIEAVEPKALPRLASVRLRASRIERLLGCAVDAPVVRDALERLGMLVSDVGEEEWQVEVPSFRPDVTMEADLIEEVARIVGYGEIPQHAPTADLVMPARPERVQSLRRVKAKLVERGYAEAITYSFTDPALQTLLAPGESTIPLSNPISSELSVMRTSLWPGLFGALLHNVNRQQARIRLFESGLVFAPGWGDEVAQEPVIGGLAFGLALPEQWAASTRPLDFYDVKGDVEVLLRAADPEATFQFDAGEHPALHPGQTARIVKEGEPLGWLGALHPRIQSAQKLSQPLYLFELSLEPVLRGRLPAFTPLSRFPAVRRDIAVVVDETISAQALRDCVGQAGFDVLHYLELFDVYRGEGIDSGRKSVGLGLTFQDASRTLRDEEIDGYVENILARLKDQLGARLR